MDLQPTSASYRYSRELEAKCLRMRVSPQSYLAGVMIGTFFTGLLFYLEIDILAIILFALSWVLLPLLALNDRVQFDGRRLERTGTLPRLWARLSSTRRRLRLSDIEQVETRAVRKAKRGGHVYYRYKTILRGRGISISLSSGGEQYRELVRAVLSRLPAETLDLRSSDLRDYLSDTKETLMKAEFARLPSGELLRETFNRSKRAEAAAHALSGTEDGDEKAEELHFLGNELRVAGYLPRALEAFRRALVLHPGDTNLLIDFARCMYSYGRTERNQRFRRRALAALRLSERKSNDDADVLTKLGEAYFQFGELERAAAVFRSVFDRVGYTFGAARGLAEIALREGKIAHVVHHFSSANRVACTASLRRWAAREADYFANLNNDEEYMDLEISRVNLLETLESSRRTALRIATASIPILIVSLLLDVDLAATIGWTISALAVVVWMAIAAVIPLFSQRIPYELVDADE